jgi:NADPH:quinone reductase-like Zn-dependent oxidoreductase
VKGIQLTGYGNPAEVVKLVDAPEVGAPGPNEVVIDIEAAPIEPSDLYMVAGVYGVLPPLPHFLGIQGVGRVSAVGRNVKYLKEGDRTITPLFAPSWVERLKTDAPWLRALPNGNVDQLSMLGINPATAYLLVTEFVHLQPGDWILQNAANSSIGRAVIAIAKARGLKTVNFVRRPELVDEVKALGGDVVLADGEDVPKRVAEATGKAPIKLALDGVGDAATQDFLNSISPFGTVMVWSAMSGKSFSVFGPPLLFRDQTIRGMWIYNWYKLLTPEKLTAMYAELAPLVVSGALAFQVAGRFTLEQYLGAIEVASKYNGKAILIPRG